MWDTVMNVRCLPHKKPEVCCERCEPVALVDEFTPEYRICIYTNRCNKQKGQWCMQSQISKNFFHLA